jgi:hypothetical protein
MVMMMRAVLVTVGALMMVGCQVDLEAEDPEVSEFRPEDVSSHQIPDVVPEVQEAPKCPGGGGALCVQCSGEDCVIACTGDFTCDMGPGWCSFESGCTS